jgi:hypothetical protein
MRPTLMANRTMFRVCAPGVRGQSGVAAAGATSLRSLLVPIGVGFLELPGRDDDMIGDAGAKR